MDDMKRAVYMLALEKISSGREQWVCEALRASLIEILGYDQLNASEDEKIELLPEFYNLYDEKCWYRFWGFPFFISLEGDMMHSSWWEFAWREPRIRILNYICQH